MIEVEYVEPCRMLFSGHAGYAPAGQDVICAGVSAMWGALAAEIVAHADEGKVEIRRDELAFQAPARADGEAMARCFEMIYGGIKLLESEYGKLIRAKKSWE